MINIRLFKAEIFYDLIESEGMDIIMKKLAILICNYNKKDYILKCISSVLESSYKEMDIYVVDNASTDDSVKVISSTFGNKITLIENKENLGGSGGFNTGIKYVLNLGYKYIYLLDNDVIIDKFAVQNLVDYLELHSNTGAVGSRIYSLDNPRIVQEFGSNIDFDNFDIKLMNNGIMDLKYREESMECDYIAACSALFRVDALKKIGTIDENYFIYWDDIDLCYRLKLAGYNVVAISNSKVWHKGGGTVRNNTFGTYYFWRNKVYFFVKYCNKEQLQKFSIKLFEQIFQAMYSCNYIGKYSSAKTIIRAVDDALNGIRGKALENRVFKLETVKDRFFEIFSNKKRILIINDTELKVLRDIINKIKLIDENSEICIFNKNDNLKLELQLNNYNFISDYKLLNFNDYDLVCNTCYHIFDIRKSMDNNVNVYVDRYFNLVYDINDRKYVKNYDDVYKMLKDTWYPVLLYKIFELKNKVNL